jgi:serine phosphatase RsbU (regulator of sigma subunit)
MPTRHLRRFKGAISKVAWEQDRFWRDLPPRALATILLAVFFTFSSLGFLTDLVALDDGQPFASALYHAFTAGSCAAVSAWAAMRRVRWWPLAVGCQLVLIFPLRHVVGQATNGSFAGLSLETRLMLDMVGATVAVALGYALFTAFFVQTGARLASVQAELRLARVIHQTLVPRIARSHGRFEFCGASESTGQVGGDVVDVIGLADDRWLAYVADVAGHGVPSALLTGMVKSAMRVRLMTPGSLSTVVADLNRLVWEHSLPSVFVTLAAIQGGNDGMLNCIFAGHPPMLQVPVEGTHVEEIARSQIPLGIEPAWSFQELSIRCCPGDLLVLVTDGLFEIFDQADQELGLEGLKYVLLASRREPLPVIRDRVQAAARQHGPRADDQTILLVRYV